MKTIFMAFRLLSGLALLSIAAIVYGNVIPVDYQSVGSEIGAVYHLLESIRFIAALGFSAIGVAILTTIDFSKP